MRFCMGGVYSPDAGKFICFSIVALIAIVAFAVVGTCTNCPAFPVYILSEPLFWILGGILLIFLSPIFYLVYCAVCAMWFPTREPGYPFESTQGEWHKRENSRFENPNRANQQRENSRFEDTTRANQQRENSRFEDPTGEYSPQREISRAEAYEKLCIAKHSMGLSITATIEQAHQKYRELAKEWHPDVNPHPQAAQKFMEVKQAYETILELNQQVV